jgi:hypothetical protein
MDRKKIAKEKEGIQAAERQRLVREREVNDERFAEQRQRLAEEEILRERQQARGGMTPAQLKELQTEAEARVADTREKERRLHRDLFKQDHELE